MPPRITLPSNDSSRASAPRTARPRGNTTYTLPVTPSNPPKWVHIPSSERLTLIAFGSFLALVEGYINGTNLFGAFVITVSHTTGSSTKFGIALVEAEWSSVGLFAALIAAFLLGGVVASAIVGDQGFRWSRRYGWVLMLEAAFLVGAWADMHTAWDSGVHKDIGRGSIWAAFACGLQNAITTTFSGAVIRTTHTTGLLTDIGVVLGQALFHPAQGKKQLWKLSVFIPLYIAFVLGGCVAVVGHRTMGEAGFLVLAGLLFFGGAVHAGYRAWDEMLQRRKKDREWEAENGREYRDEDEGEVERYRDDAPEQR